MGIARTTINTGLRAALLVVLCCLPINAAPSRGTQSRYPNELQGFKFYAKYLAPLRPGVSSSGAVREVLGDTRAVKRNGWRLTPSFYMNNKGRLGEIEIVPDGVIPMRSVRFPATFDHCLDSSKSEIGVQFDVYSDTSGLEYWLQAQSSRDGQKGDLFRIVYGRRRSRSGRNTVCRWR